MITKKEMKQFLELYLTINNVQDRAELLSNIVDTALDIVHCDAGTLYLLENNSLQFCQMHTRSLNIRQSGFDSLIDLPPVPMEESYVCAWAALHNQIINVKNVNTDKRFDFSGAARYDKLTGYHTVSMLVVPMADEKGRLIKTAVEYGQTDKWDRFRSGGIGQPIFYKYNERGDLCAQKGYAYINYTEYDN